MAAHAVAQEAIFALRRDIARIEGKLADKLEAASCVAARPDNRTGGGAKDRYERDGDVLVRRNGRTYPNLVATGAAGLDAPLGGGLPADTLIEVHSAETRDAGAASGFVLALIALARNNAALNAPVLWITAGGVFTEAGMPYAPGLGKEFGLPCEVLILADIRRLEDALWVAEEAAALTALSAVVLEVRGHARKLDLTATRRLHRRTQAAGRPLYLLRQAGHAEPTAAPVRLLVAPAASTERQTLSGTLNGSIGPPAFTVAIAKSRLAIPATVTLEWNQDECAFHERPSKQPAGAADSGAVVSASGDRPHPAREAGTVLAYRGAAA